MRERNAECACTNWGFDYVKLDFLSHGSLEGVHYDPNATTGIQAYNQGMQYLVNGLKDTMFISESIAPIFPYQYGHSRRIACDAEVSKISNSAYATNAVSCGHVPSQGPPQLLRAWVFSPIGCLGVSGNRFAPAASHLGN